MNKILKLAFTAAAVVLASSASAQSNPVVKPSNFPQSIPATQQPANANWVNGTGEHVWMSGAGENCVRNNDWSPATANKGCDGALVETPPVPVVPVPVPVPVAPPVASEKVTYNAEVLFGFDRAQLSAVDKTKLDILAVKVKGIEELEVVVVTGYTDEIGSDAYNLTLSQRRAEAVKSYLAAQGVDGNHIYTEGKGKSSPVMTGCHEKLGTKLSRKQRRHQLITCLSPNRRVEIQAVGTVTHNARPATQRPEMLEQ